MDKDLRLKATSAFSSKVLTGPKMLLLMLSNRKQGGHIMADLAKVSGLSHPTLNAAKKALEKEDLVEEHYPMRDKRTVKIYLTEKGRAEAAQLWKDLRFLLEIKEEWLACDPT